MHIVIVRHAHAESRHAWAGDDRLRPLSDRGVSQAGCLTERIAPLAPERLLSSPATRCSQTVEPLAARLCLDVTTDGRLREGAGYDEITSVLDEVVDTALTTVVSTHGDVVPLALQQLVDQGMTHTEPLMWQKGSAWIVARHGDAWGPATYWHHA